MGWLTLEALLKKAMFDAGVFLSDSSGPFMAYRTRRLRLDDRGGSSLEDQRGFVKFPVGVHNSPSPAQKVVVVGLQSGVRSWVRAL